MYNKMILNESNNSNNINIKKRNIKNNSINLIEKMKNL